MLKTFSKVLRQMHMYLALFLTPWLLMYALSTLAMNHRQFFKERYGGSLAHWEKEREQPFTMPLNANTPPRVMAEQVLRALSWHGNFNANLSKDRQTLTILRTDPVTPRRITYRPAEGKLIIEKQLFRSQSFLEGLHRRRGFKSDFLRDDLWGAMVDLVIVAMVLWMLSGLWMWWELRRHRGWGLLALEAGLASFAIFLAVL